MKKKDELIGDEIGEELFSLVQQSQGFSFVSDGMGCMNRKDFFAAVRQSLRYTRQTAREMRRFLKKHGELEKKS